MSCNSSSAGIFFPRLLLLPATFLVLRSAMIKGARNGATIGNAAFSSLASNGSNRIGYNASAAAMYALTFETNEAEANALADLHPICDGSRREISSASLGLSRCHSQLGSGKYRC